MTSDRENLTADFLLGKLTEEETLKMEEDYFSNNSRFEEILAAENDLIDDYATGKLSTEDRSRFENRLLLNAHQRRRVQFTRNLFKYAASHPLSNEDFNSSATKMSWISAVSQLFSNRPLLSLSFSLAALIVFVGATWFVINRSASEPTENLAKSQTPQISPPRETTNETANNNQNNATKPETSPSPPKNVQTQPSPKQEKSQKAPVVYALILSPGLTRAEGKNQAFTIPTKTDYVKMQLKFEQGGFNSYHAVLETVEGGQIWSSNKMKAGKNAKSLAISIPSNFLKKSDYILTLKGITKDGISETVESYAFTINP